MKKLLALTLSLAACGGSTAFKDQARDAMPSKDAVQMGSPKTAAAKQNPNSDSIEQDSTAGQHSPYFDFTVGVSAVFNGSAAAMLGVLEAVVEGNEPTSCNAANTSCTWGPGHGPLDYNNYKMVVTKDGDSFDWELSGEPLSKQGSGFVVFMSGKAKPGVQPHHGSGNFTVDFDKSNTLDGPHDSSGKLEVTSYSNVGPAQLTVSYTGAKDGDHPGQLDNIVYSYANDSTGGGDMDVGVHNTTSDARWSVHSRWKNDGRGRTDAAASGQGYSVSLAECWGAAPFNVSYFSSSLKAVLFPFGGPDSGDAAQCAFADASPSTKQAP